MVKFSGAVIANVVRLDLFAEQLNPEGGAMQPTIVGRLILPAERLDLFTRALLELAQRLKQESKAKS